MQWKDSGKLGISKSIYAAEAVDNNKAIADVIYVTTGVL